MSDQALRFLAVGGTLLVVAVSTVVMRWFRSSRPRRLGRVDLSSGVYLFSAATCLECQGVREQLQRRLGEHGFVEYRWESEPQLFDTMSIGEVPSVVVVDGEGSGRVWAGTLPPDLLGR